MPSDSPQAQQARLDGQLAALRGEAVSGNPHPMNTVHSRAWSRGHREIEEKISGR